MFNPETEYDAIQDKIDIRDFWEYQEDFVVRPPYQRKSVWSNAKQQALLDSLFRRYYIPRLVLREVIQEENFSLITLDTKRAFNEAEKIRIYRRDEGVCQICLQQGKPREECIISWSQYQADHIISWIKGRANNRRERTGSLHVSQRIERWQLIHQQFLGIFL